MEPMDWYPIAGPETLDYIQCHGHHQDMATVWHERQSDLLGFLLTNQHRDTERLFRETGGTDLQRFAEVPDVKSVGAAV